MKEKVPLIGGVWRGGGLDEKLSVFKVTQKSNITIKHVSGGFANNEPEILKGSLQWL